MPPPRCPPSPRRCCGRRIAVVLPSRRPLPLPPRCRRAVHSHRRWLIVVFYPSARCSHDEKGWLWSRSDPATLLPAAAVLQPSRLRCPLCWRRPSPPPLPPSSSSSLPRRHGKRPSAASPSPPPSPSQSSGSSPCRRRHRPALKYSRPQ
jgi:hypothetical protein